MRGLTLLQGDVPLFSGLRATTIVFPLPTIQIGGKRRFICGKRKKEYYS